MHIPSGSSSTYIAAMLTRIQKFCLTALIALALVISGQAIAQAKGASPATGHMVLCTGHGAIVVFTDADGQPTAPPYICSDCLLAAVSGTLDHAAPELQFDPSFDRVSPPDETEKALIESFSPNLARGPPLSV